MIKLRYDNDTRLSDILRGDADDTNIETDDTLQTSVFVSLFSNRTAEKDDDLPDPLGYREGWWADPYLDTTGDQFGSRLWLLRRSKATDDTLNKARIYAEEALQWMLDDGVAQSVVVEVERRRGIPDNGDMLAFKVMITRPEEPSARWVGFWEAHLALL